MININKYYFSQRQGKIDISEGAISGRKEEIAKITKLSYEYGILLKDLTIKEISIRERDRALNAAYFLIQDVETFNKFEINKKLPLQKLSRGLKVNRSVIEELNDYIIIYTLILSNPDLINLQEMLMIRQKENQNANQVVELFDVSNKDNHKGVVIKKGKKSSIIITTQGEFLNIKHSKENENGDVGEVIEGYIDSGFKKYKKFIALATMIAIILTIGFYIIYNKTSSTIVINTTSKIVYSINKNNKVVEAKSQPSKGKDLINSVSPLDKKIDYVIKESIKYASENEMVPSTGIIINVSGKHLEYGTLEETQAYINENNINVLINNNGNEQKL